MKAIGSYKGKLTTVTKLKIFQHQSTIACEKWSSVISRIIYQFSILDVLCSCLTLSRGWWHINTIWRCYNLFFYRIYPVSSQFLSSHNPIISTRLLHPCSFPPFFLPQPVSCPGKTGVDWWPLSTLFWPRQPCWKTRLEPSCSPHLACGLLSYTYNQIINIHLTLLVFIEIKTIIKSNFTNAIIIYGNFLP